MRSKSAHNIIISPVGDVAPDLLGPISEEIKRIYGYPTEVLALLDDLEFAFHPNRNQYHSTPILQQLADKAPANAIKVLALVEKLEDLDDVQAVYTNLKIDIYWHSRFYWFACF